MEKIFTKKEIVAWTDRRDASSIHTSAALGEDDHVLTLLSSDNGLIQEGDAEDTTPLHYACAVGNVATVALLLENGAQIDATNFHDETPLLWALIEPNTQKRFEKIDLLIKHGANINAANVDGETILHQSFRNAKLTSYLLQHGAHAHAKNRYDWTPLHYAMLFEDAIESAKNLINYGASINTPDDEKLTPLHLAVKHNNIPGIKLLIKHGADISAKNVDGQTAYDYACCLELDEEIKKMLK